MKILRLLTTPYPKSAAKYLGAVCLLICLAQYTWADPSPTPAPVDLNIVAHQDDDILFMNPDILNSVVAGHRQVTVYITAGNIGLNDEAFGLGPDPEYPLAREEGAIAGYSKLLQLADAIRADPNHFNDFTDVFQGDSRYPAGCGSTCFPCAQHACEVSTAGDARGQKALMKIGRNLNVATIGDGPDGPRVTLIFLRVDSPSTVDGVTPPTDLAQLFTNRNGQVQIQSRFDQPTYTKLQLINELVAIFQFVQADVVRTQDPADGHIVDYPDAEMITDHGCNGGSNFYAHTDHVWSARFAREALSRYDALPYGKKPTSYSTYMDYSLEWNEDPATRVTGGIFCLKKSIFFRYALHDGGAVYSTFPQNGFDCYSYDYIGYQKSVSMPLP